MAQNNLVNIAAPSRLLHQHLQLSVVDPDMPVVETTQGDEASDGPTPEQSDDEISEESHDASYHYVEASIASNMRKGSNLTATQTDNVVDEKLDG